MACFERASPALKDILLRLHRAKRPMELDHHLHEFGSVEYHIQSSASDPYITYLSISTPLLSHGALLSHELPHSTIEMVKGISSDVVKIIEPAREGYQLTLRLDLDKIPRGKGSVKMITEISTVQAAMLSSQLKEMLMNVGSQEAFQGMYRPIKLIYHPREPFYVVKQPAKITAVFPMRFKDDSDVIIATAFFQELMDVGSSKAWAKAPPCIWSPIPPPELRGEPIEDLSTNGGFVAFDISSHHLEGKRVDKTVWSLLNFYAFVKYHVKSTRGFIQRRMRSRMDSLVEVLQKASMEEDQRVKKVQGCRHMKKLVGFTRSKTARRRCGFANKIKRIRSRIKICRFDRFHRMSIPKFSSKTKYRKLD
ncbi:actin-related protein 2/3 complex subunit 2B [Diospyros lotus]|uniref:actin-related protein 2/3 complex subunit 2B n=1 Tax=Diospyros lotus TaxID=55363 RepID=UPI00224FC996|nr:actin-related protein 2/3 complex subunit 2B [Diospyros lotus]